MQQTSIDVYMQFWTLRTIERHRPSFRYFCRYCMRTFNVWRFCCNVSFVSAILSNWWIINLCLCDWLFPFRSVWFWYCWCCTVSKDKDTSRHLDSTPDPSRLPMPLIFAEPLLRRSRQNKIISETNDTWITYTQLLFLLLPLQLSVQPQQGLRLLSLLRPLPLPLPPPCIINRNCTMSPWDTQTLYKIN